jgi:hypothetical protein
MNENQYSELCNRCDDILRAKPTSSVRQSIAWLHIIREHPILLRPYEHLFRQSSVNKYASYLQNIKKFSIESASVLRQLVRACKYALSRQNALLATVGNCEIVFISHFTNTAQDTLRNDVYFGDLPNQMASQGKKVAILLIDHTQSSRSVFRKTTSDSGVLRVILPNTLGPSTEIGILFKLWRESHSLARKVNTETVLATKVNRAAAIEALSRSSFQALRIALQIRAFVKQLKPCLLITTYEGHAWERVTYIEARRQAPKIRCAAYQHAALFRLQHGIQRSLGPMADPDVIFTAGTAAFEQLSLSIELQRIPIKLLGSNRSGFANNIPDRYALQLRRENPVCLVLVDGLIEDCLLMLEYSMKCAALLPDVTFLWRMHPILPLDNLRELYPIFRKLPINIRLSTEPLGNDAELSSWALYRGSTAIISATLWGAAPVYLRTIGEMTIDPLYKLNKERATVDTVEDFIALLKHDNYPDWNQFLIACTHCLDIFSPPIPKVLIDYIDNTAFESRAVDA